MQQTLIGQMRPWDQILVIEFPDTDAFVKMIRDPDYQAALVHRDAGLAEVVILVDAVVAPALTAVTPVIARPYRKREPRLRRAP